MIIITNISKIKCLIRIYQTATMYAVSEKYQGNDRWNLVNTASPRQSHVITEKIYYFQIVIKGERITGADQKIISSS